VIVTLLACISCAVAISGLALECWNLRYFPMLKPASPSGRNVVVCIAVRNGERDIDACVESLLLQPEVQAIVICDDHSSDRTHRRLNDLSRDRRVTWLRSAGQGKADALATAASSEIAKRTDTLLFTDVDVRFRPGGIAALLRFADIEAAQLTSAWPAIAAGTFWDSLYSQALVLFLLQLLPFERARNARDPRFAAANGQILMVDRQYYDRAGGHAACKSIVEDVDLAHRLKGVGARIALASAAEIATVAGYGSMGRNICGYGRSLRHAAGRTGAVAFSLWQCVAYVVPLFVVPWSPLVGTLALIASLTSHLLVCNRLRNGMIWVVAGLCGVIVYASSALWIALNVRPTSWNGRLYS
jgi:glycosyltransferase involved in cell wall biosynthesis